MAFSKDVLRIDAAQVVEELAAVVKRQIRGDLRKEGAVVGISGGIDSSVVAALCVKALGETKVLGVIMPETDSDPDSATLAKTLADSLGIDTVTEPLTEALRGLGCYRRRDEAIKRLFGDFGPGWKARIVNASRILERESFNFFKLEVIAPDGLVRSRRMPITEYLQIVAASNMKQRSRMAALYYHAERLNRAVVGTGNRDEHELGFFVKWGDGAADLKPISHLFKVQVYQLAEALGIPKKIANRTPTTDTYSAEQTQTEFFFGVDFPILDLVWYATEHDVPFSEVARELDLTEEQVERVAKDIMQKRRTTEYLRMMPLRPF